VVSLVGLLRAIAQPTRAGGLETYAGFARKVPRCEAIAETWSVSPLERDVVIQDRTRRFRLD